ncbi:insulinase family protein [Luedemannella flava]|uniref:insulinase family protein n=1 Tax=Luedemannella flava TaxID=349316 RepID=UPI0031D6606A
MTSGIPTLFVKADGPMRAGLTFRVGIADETLPLRGITHLVEHLALFQHGAADHHYNGSTDATATHFHMQGTEEQVVRFLNGVCASLRDLPMWRLTAEKEILATEAVTRNSSGSLGEVLAVERHGAATFGLGGYPEWGLPAIAGDDVRDWVRTWFNRDNVILWIAGAGVPSGLELELPEGQRRPLPPAVQVLPATPAYVNVGMNAVAAQALVPRGPAARVYAEVLERTLFGQMRQDAALSYTVATAYETWGGGDASVVAVADTLVKNQRVAVDQFVTTLNAMSVGVGQADVDGAVARLSDALAEAERSAKWLPRLAVDVLCGHPVTDLSVQREALAAVTAAQVTEIAGRAWRTLLVAVPHGHLMERAGFEETPQFSRFAVLGTRHRSYYPDASLVIADDGVTVESRGGPRTVLFDACSGVLAWPDGGRHLVGRDGIQVRIEPTLYVAGVKAVAALDARLPTGLTIAMPTRAADEIPTVRRLTVWRIRARRLGAAARRGLQRLRQAWWNRGAYLNYAVPAVLVVLLGLCVAAFVNEPSILFGVWAVMLSAVLWIRRTTLGRW